MTPSDILIKVTVSNTQDAGLYPITIFLQTWKALWQGRMISK